MTCLECGEFGADDLCARCVDRHETERIIESGNEYRRKAQEHLDMLRQSDTHSSDVDPGRGGWYR